MSGASRQGEMGGAKTQKKYPTELFRSVVLSVLALLTRFFERVLDQGYALDLCVWCMIPCFTNEKTRACIHLDTTCVFVG